MEKGSVLLRIARVLLIVSIFFILLSISSCILMDEYSEYNSLTSGIFLFGYATYFTSMQIKDIHTGIMRVGGGYEIKREKTPIFFWIVFVICSIAIIWAYFLSLLYILSALHPSDPWKR